MLRNENAEVVSADMYPAHFLATGTRETDTR
jgi:hypothetical protein